MPITIKGNPNKQLPHAHHWFPVYLYDGEQRPGYIQSVHHFQCVECGAKRHSRGVGGTPVGTG